MPHRREELDYYERDTIEMAQPFGGLRFYEYHKVFTAKEAALLQQRGIKVYWAVRDNGLFCTIFAGMRANVCTSWSSVNHTSDFCSLVGNWLPNRAMAVFNVLLVQVMHHSRVKEIFKPFKEYPCVLTIMRDYALDQHVDFYTCVQNVILLIQRVDVTIR